ncbi:MAG: hypothetical protein HY303_13755 [Candidatus Wallbacteria bacterium]|nr:hypothetical protein [Candidatus Wallbacteria bacterium]
MDPLLRFRRLRLVTNPFEVIEPERFLKVAPELPGLSRQLAGDWRTLEFVGPPGSGKTTRLLFSMNSLLKNGAAGGLARRGEGGQWRFEVPLAAGPLDLLAVDDVDRAAGWFARPSPPPEAARAKRVLLTSGRPVASSLGLAPVRTVTLDRVGPEEIVAYHRARVDAVSTGPAGRYALTPEALHRLHNLSEGNYCRLNRILYHSFEGLIRDEPLEEKAIERGYGGFLLEEQESAEARGREPVLK